ncbi:DUF2877 domain-containing protein [Microbacterium kribbense]
MTAAEVTARGRCIIDLDAPQEWHARLPRALADDATMNARTRALHALVVSSGTAGGALSGPSPIDPFADAVAERLDVARAAIVRAETAGDRTALVATVERMLGLGPGLTPAGDDVLAGLALVAARPGSRIALLPGAIADVLARHPERTTDLSRTMLREALAGRARQSLIDLLERLCSPPTADSRPDALRAAAERVLGIGHTSGTDLVSGILTGLRLERELRGFM